MIQAATETQRGEWIEAIQALLDSVNAVTITCNGKRGRVERLRILLADVGVQCVVQAPKDWTELRASLVSHGLPPSLPVIELVDGTRMTHDVAAMRHFARTHNRYGSDEADAWRSDMIADMMEEWRRELDSLGVDLQSSNTSEVGSNVCRCHVCRTLYRPLLSSSVPLTWCVCMCVLVFVCLLGPFHASLVPICSKCFRKDVNSWKPCCQVETNLTWLGGIR